jgi:hypothetical protein
MKMAATWFRERRGLAVGTVVGALAVGKAGPYLLAAWPGATVGFIALAASCSALLAAVIVWAGYRDGPFPSRPAVLRSGGRGRAGAPLALPPADTWATWRRCTLLRLIPLFVAASLAAQIAAVKSPEASSPSHDRRRRRAASRAGWWRTGSGGRAGHDSDGSERQLCHAGGLTFGRSLWLLAPVAGMGFS